MMRPLLALLAAAAGPAAAQSPGRSAETLLLANATVIDGRGGAALPNQHLLIRDGRIAAIVSAAAPVRGSRN